MFTPQPGSPLDEIDRLERELRAARDRVRELERERDIACQIARELSAELVDARRAQHAITRSAA